jgi:hypothetical protein
MRPKEKKLKKGKGRDEISVNQLKEESAERF